MEEIDVPVAGGTLRVLSWPGDGPLVIAAHGITANGLSWAGVARALRGRVHLVAPDLRGRAGSASVTGPFGMAAHAGDLMAVASHFGAGKVALAYALRDFADGRSLCNADAVRADATDMLRHPLPAPFPLLWAPRGMTDEPGGLYRADQLTGVDAELIPDVNHYTILLGSGAARVAERIVALV